MTPREASLWAVVAAHYAFIVVRVKKCIRPPFAEDVVQLVMLRAWLLIAEGRATFDEAQDVNRAAQGWLVIIIARVAADWRKAVSGGWVRGGVEIDDDLAGPDPMIRIEARDALRRTPYGLSKRERETLDAFGRGMTTREVATALGIPMGTASDRLRRIRRHLRGLPPKKRSRDK